ncbi:hypothetical protein [Peribacillus frigoritolerans]|nr:hypothetical protein [Peribacillus frigoritolerans]MDM5309720.1 hypothetical protein [Peribacillus frigoritolerans]
MLNGWLTGALLHYQELIGISFLVKGNEGLESKKLKEDVLY